MNLRLKAMPLIKSPWFMAFLFLLIFLATTGYKYGWDDQHVEIPLLKSLIDAQLYQGDYYVESLKKNFTSFFYIILSKFITVDQIPSTYLFLFLVSRYFLFFWIYKIWLHITKSIKLSFINVFIFILLTRVPEFLYRTFSHQEFSLAIIFAGIYFFFRERFYLAALLLGITANFHALYALFPMIYILTYLLWQVRREGVKKLFGTLLIFTLSCLPFLIWSIKNRLAPSSFPVMKYPGWKTLYVVACPQNFMLPLIKFSEFLRQPAALLEAIKSYLSILGLFLINFFFNDYFRKNKKALAFCYGAFFLLFLCLLFTYFYPIRFVLDLNLIRNTQYLNFLLMGFTFILLVKTIETAPALVSLSIAALFSFFKYGDLIETFSIFTILFLFTFLHWRGKPPSVKRKIFCSASAAGIIVCLIKIYFMYDRILFRWTTLLNLSIIFSLLIINYFTFNFLKDPRKRSISRKLFYIIPFVIFFYQYTYYSFERKHIEETSTGFWHTQKSWEDMQRYVKDNTPKNSLLLVPYDMEMGGFRIFSERKIIASFRDCGIVGFDYSAGQQWVRRIHDILNYKVSIEGPISTDLKNAITKYRVNYIVFLRYAAPKNDSKLLKRIYTNSDMVLFKVKTNPVPPLK